MTAAVAVERGRSLRDYNTDTRTGLGSTARTATRTGARLCRTGRESCHAFLAVGPARPDTVVHVLVETEELEAPLTGGDAHSCVFAETLVSASSLNLEPAVPPTK
jgi:hypothetical protein